MSDGERARLREGGFAPAEIPPRERAEFAALEGALRDAAERKRGILRDHERDRGFFRNRRIDRAELAKRQESYSKRVAEENEAIEEAEVRMVDIKARAALDAATVPPRREDAPEEAEATRHRRPRSQLQTGVQNGAGEGAHHRRRDPRGRGLAPDYEIQREIAGLRHGRFLPAADMRQRRIRLVWVAMALEEEGAGYDSLAFRSGAVRIPAASWRGRRADLDLRKSGRWQVI